MRSGWRTPKKRPRRAPLCTVLVLLLLLLHLLVSAQGLWNVGQRPKKAKRSPPLWQRWQQRQRERKKAGRRWGSGTLAPTTVRVDLGPGIETARPTSSPSLAPSQAPSVNNDGTLTACGRTAHPTLVRLNNV